MDTKTKTEDVRTPRDPYITSPADWEDNGLPYGAWCKCSKCGLIRRSTVLFDFYAKGAFKPLTCEICERQKWVKI